jgi:hypothetical protein
MRMDQAGARAPIPLFAWTNRTFLYLFAANLILKGALLLFRARLLPRSTLPLAQDCATNLASRAQRLRLKARWRRRA